MDLVDVSQRLIGLRQEIRDLQDQNSQYQDRGSHNHTDNSAQEQRRLRLVQIKDELADMKRRQARHWKGWQRRSQVSGSNCIVVARA